MKLRLRTMLLGTFLLCGLFAALWAVDLRSPGGEGVTLKQAVLPPLARQEEGGSALERLEPAWGSVTCSAPEAGKLYALSGPQVQATSGTQPTVNLPAGDWWVQWESPGKRLSLGHISIESGEVLRCQLDDNPTILRGKVANRRGSGVPNVPVLVVCSQGPGLSTLTDSNGRFSMDIEGSWLTGACTLSASINTGLLQRTSESVEVTVFDRDVPVELLLDDRPVAGLGVVLRMVPEGALVEQLHPDSPAERAGLRSNDIIVMVDGTSAENMDIGSFRQRATGEVGSRVELVISREGKRIPISFRRDIIEDKKKEDTGLLEGEE